MLCTKCHCEVPADAEACPSCSQVVAETMALATGSTDQGTPPLTGGDPSLGDRHTREGTGTLSPAGNAAVPDASLGEESTLALGSTHDSQLPRATHKQLSSDVLLGRFGNYDLIAELARGGMGVVYKARQRNPNRIVALKMIRESELATADTIERFRQETEAAAGLNHPGIVGVYDAGYEEHRHYYAMEFVEGQTLDKLVAEHPLPGHEAARYLRDIATAIAFAHTRGVLHRDLKPSNVILDEHDRPRVMDFGLAKRLTGDSALTATGEILGTPSYMPPEQALGQREKMGPASDVYALGALLYALLTSRAPFAGESIGATIQQVIHKDPVPPRQLNPAVDADLEAICLRCLEKEPGKRYATAEALIEDFDCYLAFKPLMYARPIGRVGRSWRWCRRNPVVASLSATAVLLLTTLAATASIGYLELSRAFDEVENQRSLTSEQAKEAERQRAEAAAQAEEAELQRSKANEQTREAQRQEAFAAEQATEAEKQRAIATERAEEAQWQLYLARIAAAQQSWEANEVSAAWLNLEACPEELRGWEYYYLRELFSSASWEDSLVGNEHLVSCLAYSHDGENLVSGGTRGSMILWDISEGRIKRTLTSHKDEVTCAAFSPDDRRIVSGGADGTIKVWDIATDRQELSFAAHSDKVSAIAFSPDGAHIVSVSDDESLRVWETATGKETLKLYDNVGFCPLTAFTPDGRYVVASDWDLKLSLWDVQSGEEGLIFEGHEDIITCYSFSSDGRFLVTGGTDSTVRVWDMATAEPLLTIPAHDGEVIRVGFAGDSQQIVSVGEDNTTRIWDTETGRLISTIRMHVDEVGNESTIAIRPDGKQLVTTDLNTVRVWNLERTDSNLVLPDHRARVTSLDFSPNGKEFVSTGWDSMLYFWETETGEQRHGIRTSDSMGACVAYSPDGKWIAVGGEDGFLRVWNAESRRKRCDFRQHEDTVQCVAFSPDSQWLVSASHDHTLLVWDLQGREVAGTFNTESLNQSVAFSPDGSRLLVGDNDGTLRLLDFPSGEELFAVEAHAYIVSSVAFSPDGRWFASASWDGTVKLWDGESDSSLQEFLGHTLGVEDLAFSPDGQRLATASEDRTLKLWDVTTGEETLTLRGHTSAVNSVAFSPSGDCLASGSSDGTVWLRNAALRESNHRPTE